MPDRDAVGLQRRRTPCRGFPLVLGGGPGGLVLLPESAAGLIVAVPVAGADAFCCWLSWCSMGGPCQIGQDEADRCQSWGGYGLTPLQLRCPALWEGW